MVCPHPPTHLALTPPPLEHPLVFGDIVLQCAQPPELLRQELPAIRLGAAPVIKLLAELAVSRFCVACCKIIDSIDYHIEVVIGVHIAKEAQNTKHV